MDNYRSLQFQAQGSVSVYNCLLFQVMETRPLESTGLLPSSGWSGAECTAPNPQLDFCWLGDVPELEPGFTEPPRNTEHRRELREPFQHPSWLEMMQRAYQPSYFCRRDWLRRKGFGLPRVSCRAAVCRLLPRSGVGVWGVLRHLESSLNSHTFACVTSASVRCCLQQTDIVMWFSN